MKIVKVNFIPFLTSDVRFVCFSSPIQHTKYTKKGRFKDCALGFCGPSLSPGDPLVFFPEDSVEAYRVEDD